MLKMRGLRAFFLLVCLALPSCGPQGQVERIIHPPLNFAGSGSKYQEKAAASSKRMNSGLPSHCQAESRVKGSFCISCDEGGVDIERCYAFQGHFDTSRNCVYSLESIKCLNADPPFALKITRKASLEKALMEHTRLWQDSLRAIARPSLTESQQAELEEALENTGQLVKALVKARKGSGWIDHDFPKLLPSLQKSIIQLQQSKESGHLKLHQVLEVSRALLEAAGTPASILHYWTALSVDGLDEPGE